MLMNNWSEFPIQLARTRQGEIILFAEGELWYAFRFGSLQRYLTADDFYRLHDSALAIDLDQAPAKPIQLDGEVTPRVALTVTLFGSFTRSDLVELRALLSRAALLVTALARAYNDVN